MATAAKYKVYNGSAWVELTFTPSSHTHSEYLPLSGGTITGDLTVNNELTVASCFHAPWGCWADDGIWIGYNDETYIGDQVHTTYLEIRGVDWYSGYWDDTGIYIGPNDETSINSSLIQTPEVHTEYLEVFASGVSYGYWADDGIWLGENGETHIGNDVIETTEMYAQYLEMWDGEGSYGIWNRLGIEVNNLAGITNPTDGNAIGFDDSGVPTILNKTGRILQIATDTLDGDYMQYTFPEYGGYVPVTETQGMPGQFLVPYGDGTYSWQNYLNVNEICMGPDDNLYFDGINNTYTIDGSQIVTKATESVIDLGTISSTPASATCADLDNIKTPGIYTFKVPGYSADYPTTYIMTVSLGYAGSSTAPVYQHILGCNSTSAPHTYIRYCNTSGVWSYTSYAPRNCAASGNTSSKLFLIGRTSQSSTGGTTYSHDTVYVDASGQLCGTAGVYTNKILAPTTDGGSTYGAGANGQVLKSNGTTSYWGTVSGSGADLFYLQGRKTIALNEYAEILSLLDIYNEVMIVVRVVTNGTTTVGVSTATSGTTFNGSILTTGTSYIKILINRTDEDNYAVEMISSINNTSSFGWITNPSALYIRNYSTAATSVTMSLVVHGR